MLRHDDCIPEECGDQDAMEAIESPTKPARNQEAFQSGSFLLRIWIEGREIEGQTPKPRVFVRNLKTGEEHYLGDLDQLGDEVLRQFQQTGPALGGAHRPK